MEKKNDFKPFIPADKVLPEFTVTSVILGMILAVIFGGANAYLGLRVGMTVSASIPAAVISMGVIRVIMKKDSILENNMVQTIGSAGESLAAGAIFTIPAIFIWASEKGSGISTPSFVSIALIALCGGILGVLFMVPLRTALIVEEHGTLPYPEGTACAEVLLAGEEGGSKSKVVFAGLGIAAVYKFIADGLKLFPSEVDFSMQGEYTTAVGMDVLPALAGVGYIFGVKISSYLFAGGVLSYLVLIPAIAYFGGESASKVVDDAGKAIAFNQLSASQIWSNYTRYIGAGAVAAGGLISLIKTFPTMIRTFKHAIKGFGKKGDSQLTEQDISMKLVLGGSLVIAVLIWLLPEIPVSFLGALIVVVFGFFFATVSSRMVGIVGSSNNPVSGMAIATLIVTTFILKATGNTGATGMVSAISIGTVICIVAAMAGDTSQDLKTGYIVGATPRLQQIGELIGAIVSAFAIGGVMYLLNSAWGFGSEQIPAPQATLMKMVVEGVMGGTLPWVLIFMGVFIAIVVEVLGIPVLAFSIGLYLPIYLSTPIMVGGVIKWFIDNKRKYANDEERKDASDRGILYAAGMIAGEGIVGIILAILAVVNVADKLNLSSLYGESGAFQTVGNWVGLIAFVLLLSTLFHFTKGKKTIEVDAKEK